MRAPARGSTQPPWMRPVTERLSPTITTLVLVSVVMFAFYAVVKPAQLFVAAHLALTPAALIVPEPWQIATSLFVHLEPFNLLFNLIGLWFDGATIEREQGRTRFLLLFFVPAVVANLAMAVVMWMGFGGQSFSGSSLSVLALFVAFGRLYGRTPARVWGGLVLEARTLTLILIGFSLFADLARANLVAFGGDVIAVAIAFGLSGRRGAGFEDLFRGLPGGKPRRRFQVVEGGAKPGGDAKEGRRAGYLN